MKKIKKTIGLLKKQGGSLVGLLIASGILGISSVALIGYMQSTSVKIKSVTEKHSVSFDIHASVINSLRGLLIETKVDQDGDQHQNNRWGVCSLIKVPKKTHGVDSIQMQLSSSPTGLAYASFSDDDRWEVFFDKSEYELLSSKVKCDSLEDSFSSLSDYFSRCFKYIGKKSETANEMYVIARIIPQKFPKFEKINLGGNPLDVKLVTFKLEVIVGVNGGGKTAPLKYSSLAWSNEVVECELEVRGEWTNVQFAGTGTGRLSNKLVINHPSFKNQIAQCSEMQFIDIPSGYIMGGRFLENRASIAADHEKNKKIVCRKRVYRCPGDNGQLTDFFPQIEFLMGVLNNFGGNLYYNKLNFTLLDQNGDEIDSLNDGQLSTVPITVDRTGTKRSFPANTNLTSTVKMISGFSMLRFHLGEGEDNPGPITNLCQNVCNNGARYYPSVSVEFDYNVSENSCNYSRSYTEDEHRIGCNICHSKSCQKIGIGAFGPVSDESGSGGFQGLLDEPEDGTMPECKIEGLSSAQYELPSVTSGSGECVAIKATNVNAFKNFGSAQYEFQNCANPLPVLCFAFGHYLPAMERTSPTADPSIFTGDFEAAQKACYEMGKELVSKEHLAEYFKRYWPNIFEDTNASVISALSGLYLSASPLDANYFEYVNNASRGIFIVPSYNISALSNLLRDSYLQKFFPPPPAPRYDKLWVPIEKDAGSQLTGSIPLATVAESHFSVFTRKPSPIGTPFKDREQPRALILNDTNNLSPLPSDKDTVLTHNVRYKGVYNVSGGSNKVLCRKDTGDHFELVTSSLANAPTACGTGYAFLPPMSSLEWVKAMSHEDLNPNDEMYPFPNPGDFSGENYKHSLPVPAPKVWVALSRADGSEAEDGLRAKNWRLSKAYFPDSDSVFKTESFPDPGDTGIEDYIGIIDYRGKPVEMPQSIKNNYQKILSTATFESLYRRACFTDPDSQGQVEVQSSVQANVSCGTNKTEVKKSDLLGTKNLMKSIKFMSEWVQEYTNTSEEFIVDENVVIRQAKEQARRKKCILVTCLNQRNSCRSSCNSVYSSCTPSCAYTYPCTIGGVLSTCNGVNSSCMSGCSNARTSCRNVCNTNFINCKCACRSNNDISSHLHLWWTLTPEEQPILCP